MGDDAVEGVVRLGDGEGLGDFQDVIEAFVDGIEDGIVGRLDDGDVELVGDDPELPFDRTLYHWRQDPDDSWLALASYNLCSLAFQTSSGNL